MEDVVPTYVLVSSIVEVACCALVLVACLTVVRRGPAALLASIGALLAGGATGASLILKQDPDWWRHERLFELTTYSRAFGLATLGLALVLALVHSRRVGNHGGPSRHQ